MPAKSPDCRKVPGFSVVGLLTLFVSVGWAIYAVRSSRASSEFGGFAGFAVLMILMATIPVSFICGLIGLLRNEGPKLLTWGLMTLSAIPMLVILVEMIITSNS
jgi:hypothetical protein